ncbi:mannose-6-phosphate isomerase [Testicularia cyperi]|uniref:Mannose-6-phosphate isomerase n=1 Tax=Testicularia cyperi TaxID=1882483 RepID=A0A317XSC5_9BASI|nr:mannose-6-phosphate isomerase [Testicularia cyperi]
MASTSDLGAVFQLIPGVQSYDWGIKGANCRVAEFANATSQLHFQPQQDKPYAELWMGTHTSMPSRIVPPTSPTSASESQDDFPTLSSYLAAKPELIGQSVASKFSDEQPGCLPFLFKVLSVGKALSIQAHPDKQLGKKLHAERPNVYKDPNHKPEMAVALTPFSGFCGFRPLDEIVEYLDKVPEFAALVNLSADELSKAKKLAASSDADETEVKAVLKLIFGNLMRSSQDVYEAKADEITQRFSSSSPEALQVPQRERELLLKLSSEFPSDIGIFCTFLLNISSLSPGEALFLQANEPHAYLEGEILECMASSDNVVRAGLTPKLRDVETLVEMCTYQSGKGRGQMQAHTWSKASGSGKALLYDPPIQEFSVAVCSIDTTAESQKHDAVQGPSILLLLDGEAEVGHTAGSLRLQKGQLAFVGADTPVEITAKSTPLRFARAFVEA